MSDLQAQTTPYVRDRMLPQAEPPLGESGVLRWLRDNLFSSWMNGILTVVSLAVVAWLLWAMFPWFANSVWRASSLDECREILKEHGAETGACFGVITERWKQLLYGFYPRELYWRANMTLLLLAVALAPVLFADWQARTRGIVALTLFVLSGLMVWGTYWGILGSGNAFVLMLIFAAASAAVYRFDLTRNFMLIFSAIYPFLLVWLVWGGTIWGPLAALGGFGVGYVGFKLFDAALGALAGIIAGVLATVIFWLVVGPNLVAILNDGVPLWMLIWLALGGWLAVLVMRHALASQPAVLQAVAGLAIFFAWGAAVAPDLTAVFNTAILHLGTTQGWGIQAVESRDLGGFMVSIIIGVAGIALSLPLGVVLALGRQSNLFIVHTLCVGFIEFIRGVPLITLLFTASLLLNYFLPPGTNFDIILRVIIMVTLFASAYMAETIRGGLAALPKGQYEGADSLGLDYWQAQRLVIMPQALKISIPGIVNNFIGLFKDTTLVTFIGILDILNLTNSIRANSEWHGIYWELYIFVGLMFFITCFTMGRYSKWLEQKLHTDHR
ncbi:amino acid ABC transporter permease [Frigidibacter sp. ROC022]|uniref:amino acid ABC transporter permease n=1 Tax=Frigidibacter sp. ROC022 TaxID=2971796 RepID=UPI00215A4F14|nr:amino acid ABC transporter permease [Frigidibacter sp. ROC022]MCR8726587.1 amino acid ABC transporter permease [Frigidibacter sp. ROC022]